MIRLVIASFIWTPTGPSNQGSIKVWQILGRSAATLNSKYVETDSSCKQKVCFTHSQLRKLIHTHTHTHIRTHTHICTHKTNTFFLHSYHPTTWTLALFLHTHRLSLSLSFIKSLHISTHTPTRMLIPP